MAKKTACKVITEFISYDLASIPPGASPDDPFHHEKYVNSHNHHDLHPWGPTIEPNSEAFNALYVKAHNEYRYSAWFRSELAPYMATRVIGIHHLSQESISNFVEVLKVYFTSSLEGALNCHPAKALISDIDRYLSQLMEEGKLTPSDELFVRLDACSPKDSPTPFTNPPQKQVPLPVNAKNIVSRIITSGRCISRLLALTHGIWSEDPGEVLIIQKFDQDIDCKREMRTFICGGRITAISQDQYYADFGWRKNYSGDLVEAIIALWEKVKGLVPYENCLMDVHLTWEPDVKTGQRWDAKIVEFNPFGAHLNSGSALFHWVKDYDILHGKREGIVVRFADKNPASASSTKVGIICRIWELMRQLYRYLYSKNAGELPAINETTASRVLQLDPQPKHKAQFLGLIVEGPETMEDGTVLPKERPNLEKRPSLPLGGRWSTSF